MQVINFFNPQAQQKVYGLLTHLWATGMDYQQVAEELALHDVYMPEDQWEAFYSLLSIQVDLDIGDRQAEVPQ